MRVWMTGLHGIGHTAGLAQMLAVDVGEKLGFKELGQYCYQNGDNDETMNARIDGILSPVEDNDVVILQYPSWINSKYDLRLAERVKFRMPSAHVVIFIHDIQPFMFGQWDDLEEWMPIYNKAEVLIVPNHFMKDYLLDHGCTCKKFVYQYIWDNPSDIAELNRPISQMKKLVQFPSDPRKFQFVKDWPTTNIPFHYYSHDKLERDGLIRHNPIPNEELLLQMHRLGGYGILWEPPELKLYWGMNTSMKFGAYMSAGLPVIIHKGIAQEEIVKEFHLGKVVESEQEAVDFIDQTTEKQYLELANNVNKMGSLTRNGLFLKQALMEAVYRVFN